MLNYLDGYDRKEVTLAAMGNTGKGKTVSVTSDFTVKNAPDGAPFAGVCTHVENNTASVLLSGFVTVPYTGDAPTCGYNKLVGNGIGGVKKSESGRDILVVAVDNTAAVCGIIL